MEGGGHDYYGASSRDGIVKACLAEGASKFLFTCEGWYIKLNKGRNRETEFRECGIVVTDAPCVHFVEGDEVTVTTQQPAGHVDIEGVDSMIHITAAEGVGWDIIMELPVDRHPIAREVLTPLLDTSTPLHISDLVAQSYPWVNDVIRKKLGMLIKDSKSAPGHWRTEHRAAHSRKRSELDSLRARSRSRDKKTPKERTTSSDQFAEEEQTLRATREKEAADRLSSQQQALEEGRVKQDIALAAKMTELKAINDAEAAEARQKKEATETQQLQELLAMREEETRQMSLEREEREKEDRQAWEDRQEHEKQLLATKEKLRLERIDAEERHRQEMNELKAKREDEDMRQRQLAAERYEQSQVHRLQRQSFVRDEGLTRAEILKEEAESLLLLQDTSREIEIDAAKLLMFRSVEDEEVLQRLGVERQLADEFHDLEWERDKHYAHVCEVGRRRVMEDEEKGRRLISAKEEAELGALASRYLEASMGFFVVEDDDDWDDSLEGTPVHSPTTSAPPTVPRVTFSDNVTSMEDSPHRATQTPSYNFNNSTSIEDDTLVASELANLHKEIKHERELRERNQERIADHEKQMQQKALQLQERERKLLSELGSEHSKRLEDVRNMLQPRIAKAESFEEADRLLATMAEREGEWNNRDKEWRLRQVELEREATRARDELARVTELHWLVENDKAELKGRLDANEIELASMRTTIDRADSRLRHVLLEEQELLCRVEEQWKSKLNTAETNLIETEGKLKRKLEERERYWMQQEKNIRSRCERAEKEKLAMIEKLEALQHRSERGEREKRKLQEELSAESQLASHKSAACLRDTRDTLDRERRRRIELEEALNESMREQKKLIIQLDDVRKRHVQHAKDSQLVAALHESELSRVERLLPTRSTEFSILIALETAARYALMAQWQEGCTDLVSMLRRRPPVPAERPASTLQEQNNMLRELLSLEESKVSELERALGEVRRQRDELTRSSKRTGDVVGKLMVEEADARLAIESSCRDELVERLTSRRKLVKPYTSPSRPASPPIAECSGWLLASLDGLQKASWKQLFMWIEEEEGVLYYSPTIPRGANVPVSSLSLDKILAVEIEMFIDTGRPPPVSKYQQLGFSIETNSGLKHRFCASSVAERTEWLDHLRRTVISHSNVWSASWDPRPVTPPPSPRRHRRTSRPVNLEHLSYMDSIDVPRY